MISLSAKKIVKTGFLTVTSSAHGSQNGNNVMNIYSEYFSWIWFIVYAIVFQQAKKGLKYEHSSKK